jgi:hypothetical protein
MTTVGCYLCHRLLHTGDQVVEVSWPAVGITLSGVVYPRTKTRYLCEACDAKEPQAGSSGALS